LQRLCRYLPESGLAETACLPTVYRSTLNVIRLTERGKQLAHVLGVEPIENDWERVIPAASGRGAAGAYRAAVGL
jgi:hypothetical protein